VLVGSTSVQPTQPNTTSTSNGSTQKIKYKITQKLVGYPKNTITGFLDVAGDGEIAFLPARHVEARLLLGPQHGELARH